MNTTKNEVTGSILGRAMLANVRISVWEARKHDRRITEEVNTAHAAGHDVGRYHKHLFGGKVESHQAVINAAVYARTKHHANTLPWSDAGWRLLPTTNYFAYTEELRRCQAQFEQALEEFLADYPRLKEEARAKLNGMFREEDYPSVEQIRRRFAFELEFQPLPSGDDFRVTLPQEELARVGRSVEGRITRAVEDAARDTWRRLAEAVEILDNRLHDDGRFLRDTMIIRIREVAESLGRLNVTEDQALEEMRERVLAELGGLDAGVLRQDQEAREATAAKTTAVLDIMRGMYG